ncbi:pectinesterase 3 [Phtheirospermum japonicum]|uniref:Pectinesterase 3 n=1 Tax=Phtheirospermum japonicum TaxID=374723 RepID=A0A830DII4_9LAMI|nr:pectinesterase 3 [Phtheirospermum japonicum]
MVDFIFGNAVVVFQNYNINPRQPMPNQFNTITERGKRGPNQNTGICVHKCVIRSSVNVTTNTYLGWPWKDFSTTVIMKTNISRIVSPLGWTPWVDKAVPPASIFYAKYLNIGAGVNMSNRVKWHGYKSNLTTAQASKYDVQSFIDGTSWVPVTGVTYEATFKKKKKKTHLPPECAKKKK